MNHTEIEQRLSGALTAAATRRVPDGTRPPGLPAPAVRRPTRWPVVALAAAAAVSLAVTIPYGLRYDKQEPEVSPATVAPADPSPLGPPLPPTVQPFYLMSIIDPDGDGNDIETTIHKSDRSGSSVIEGNRFSSSTAAPDGTTFYLSWTDDTADCTARVLKVTIGPDGREASRAEVESAAIAGKLITNLALSPDGKRLAMAYTDADWSGTTCGLGDPQGIVLLDLTTSERTVWKGPDGPTNTMHNLAWSMDGRYLMFFWPMPRASAPPKDDSSPRRAKPHLDRFRILDTTVPSGDLLARSLALPPDPTFEQKFDSLLVLSTSQSYPPALLAYAPQGGARVLATAGYANAEGHPFREALVDIRLGSGKIVVIDPDYTPTPEKPGW